MLREPVAALSDPQHHVPLNWIAQLFGDVARVFRALAPVIRVVEDGYAHDDVTLSAFRPAGSADQAILSPPEAERDRPASALASPPRSNAMVAANAIRSRGSPDLGTGQSGLRGVVQEGLLPRRSNLDVLPRRFYEAIHRRLMCRAG